MGKFPQICEIKRYFLKNDVEMDVNPSNNKLSVEKSKGQLVIQRLDSIKNLFGCELHITEDDTDNCTFIVSRLNKYKVLDDDLIRKLKVSLKYIDSYKFSYMDVLLDMDDFYFMLILILLLGIKCISRILCKYT